MKQINGLGAYLNTIGVNIGSSDACVHSSYDSPISVWILASGVWNDSGVWDDNSTWID